MQQARSHQLRVPPPQGEGRPPAEPARPAGPEQRPSRGRSRSSKARWECSMVLDAFFGLSWWRSYTHFLVASWGLPAPPSRGWNRRGRRVAGGTRPTRPGALAGLRSAGKSAWRRAPSTGRPSMSGPRHWAFLQREVVLSRRRRGAGEPRARAQLLHGFRRRRTPIPPPQPAKGEGASLAGYATHHHEARYENAERYEPKSHPEMQL